MKLLAEWFWVDRWSGSTAFSLPLEARGLYREMLSQAWRRGARLPNDPEGIRRLVGATAREWRRAWPLIAKYWTVEGDELVNETQVTIYRVVLKRAELDQARARAGARGRWQGREQLDLNDAQAMPEHMPEHMLKQSSSNARAPAQAMPEHMPEQCDPDPDPVRTTPPNPPAVAGGPITRSERKWAENARRLNGGKCPHDDECTDRYACIGRLVGEKRAAEKRGVLDGIRS